MRIDLQVNGIPGQPELQPRGNAGGQITTIGGGGKEHGVGLCGADGVCQRVAHGTAPDRAAMSMVQHQEPICPVGGQLVHHPFLCWAEQHCRHLAPGRGSQRPGFAEHL